MGGEEVVEVVEEVEREMGEEEEVEVERALEEENQVLRARTQARSEWRNIGKA